MSFFDSKKFIKMRLDEYLEYKLRTEYLPDNKYSMETKAGPRVVNVNKGIRTKFMRRWKCSEERISDINTFVRFKNYEEYKSIMDIKELIFSEETLSLREVGISQYLNEDEFYMAHKIFSDALASGMVDSRYNRIIIERS